MKINHSVVIVLMFISLVFSSCLGQNNDRTANEKGKVVSSLSAKIWSILQDQKGNYWFGSNGQGVFLYDGNDLRLFTRRDGLVDNTIRGIQEDVFGNIYIETPNGVSKYDGEGFTTLKIDNSPTNDWKLTSDDLWFNCNGNARDVYRYNGQSLIPLRLPRQNLQKALGIDPLGQTYSAYTVFGIDKDSKGNVWFGTVLAGAFRYDGESFLWIAEKELSRLKDGREPGVRSILEDEDGKYWLSNFIYRYDLNDRDDNKAYSKSEGVKDYKSLLGERIPYFNSGLKDKNGVLWMTTYSGGVWKYDGAQLMNIPVKEGNKHALIIRIYQDSGEQIWIGTDNIGVFRFNGFVFRAVFTLTTINLHPSANNFLVVQLKLANLGTPTLVGTSLVQSIHL